MARAPSKTADTVKATIAAAATAREAGAVFAAEGEGATPPAPAIPTHVRLTGSGTYSGGKLLPIGKALEVGVEIPEALALARLAAGTAEAVLGSAVSAKGLRDAVSAFAAEVRAQLDELTAKIDTVADADLVDLVVDGLFTKPRTDESRALAEAMEAAIAAHREAIDVEGLDSSGDGEGAA